MQYSCIRCGANVKNRFTCLAGRSKLLDLEFGDPNDPLSQSPVSKWLGVSRACLPLTGAIVGAAWCLMTGGFGGSVHWASAKPAASITDCNSYFSRATHLPIFGRGAWHASHLAAHPALHCAALLCRPPLTGAKWLALSQSFIASLPVVSFPTPPQTSHRPRLPSVE